MTTCLSAKFWCGLESGRGQKELHKNVLLFVFKLLLFVLLISTLMFLYISEFVSGSPLKPTSVGSVFTFQLIVSLKHFRPSGPPTLRSLYGSIFHTLAIDTHYAYTHKCTHTNINTVPAQRSPKICFKYWGFFFLNWKLIWQKVDFIVILFIIISIMLIPKCARFKKRMAGHLVKVLRESS